jgi:hypothetical protein
MGDLIEMVGATHARTTKPEEQIAAEVVRYRITSICAVYQNEW